MEFDAAVVRLLDENFWPLIVGLAMGGVAAFAYLAVLARVHLESRVLVDLYRECLRRRVQEERFFEAWGFSPRLDYYRRLETRLRALLARQGIR